MSSARFEPIALQLSKRVWLDQLLPADGLDRTPREPPARAPGEAPSDADVEHFELCYQALTRAASQLLNAPQFDRLLKLHDRIQQEFKPGGPPMSPVYDSYALLHILAEVPQGIAAETPFSVLARLFQSDRREGLQRLARALADSHLDLYRVHEARGRQAQLERLRTPVRLSVGTSGPVLRTGDLLLARVLAFDEGHFIADSPYLLRSPEQDWLEHFERVAAQTADAFEAATAAREQRPAAHAKLSAKRQALLRQQKKQTEREQTPEVAVREHLQHGPSERYWLDFILAAYAGERRGIVYLAGVPDRPETLPHHDDYAAAGAAGSSPTQLDADAVAELQARMLERILASLDEPVPELDGKSLRSLAQDPDTRADVIDWLHEQERQFQQDPRSAGIDLRSIWQELGLELQGASSVARGERLLPT